MKNTELGSTKNIGNFLRWFVMASCVAMIAVPVIKWQPWAKVGSFIDRATSTPKNIK